MTPRDAVPPAGRVTVVTGGTRGIGLLTAEHLARQGWSVAVCSRSADDAIRIAESIASEHGVTTFGDGVDITDAAAVGRFADQVLARLGTPELVINNAAVLGPVGPIGDVDLGEWAAAMAINVTGSAIVTASFAPAMIAAGRGRVIMLSGGGVGGPGVAPRLSAYTSSKAAIAMLVETLGAEFEPHGVQVAAVAPGAQPTAFTAGILDAGPEVAGDDLFVATERNAHAAVAFEPFGALVDYLSSDDARWLTGRVLSARWETPAALRAQRDEILAGDRFRLRRIDAVLYDALPAS